VSITRVLKSALRTGLPFGIFMGLIFTVNYGYTRGLIGGVISGLLFGLAMGLFVETQRKRLEIKSSIFEGEKIIFQGPANHFLNAEGRGGWLLLTGSRLIFRSHGKNLQNQSLEIPLPGIRSIDAANTLGIVPNGLEVETLDGHYERFVLSDRESWVRQINNLLQTSKSDSLEATD